MCAWPTTCTCALLSAPFLCRLIARTDNNSLLISPGFSQTCTLPTATGALVWLLLRALRKVPVGGGSLLPLTPVPGSLLLGMQPSQYVETGPRPGASVAGASGASTSGAGSQGPLGPIPGESPGAASSSSDLPIASTGSSQEAGGPASTGNSLGSGSSSGSRCKQLDLPDQEPVAYGEHSCVYEMW